MNFSFFPKSFLLLLILFNFFNEKYGLVEAQKEQQKMVDDAKAEVEKYTQKLANGEKIVIAPKFIKAGSLVAYESGVNYYASVDKHKSGEGVTMAINAKEGHMLPENIKEYGHEIVEQLKNEDGSSGAFLHPNGSMFVVGGPKNPDVKLDKTQEEVIDEISQLFKEYSDKEVESQEKEEVPPMPEINIASVIARPIQPETWKDAGNGMCFAK